MAEDGDKLPHFRKTLAFLSSEQIPRSHSFPPANNFLVLKFLVSLVLILREVAAFPFLWRSPLSARFDAAFKQNFIWNTRFYQVLNLWSLSSQSGQCRKSEEIHICTFTFILIKSLKTNWIDYIQSPERDIKDKSYSCFHSTFHTWLDICKWVFCFSSCLRLFLG